jgi:hypothetical protein
MNCAEFQKVLPYIIETGGNAEEEAHLSACPVCSDLVQDLRYIAECAKLLLPMHDPSPQVWENIQGSLERDGLVKPGRARGRLLGSIGSNLLWIAAGTAILLVVLTVALLKRGQAGQAPYATHISAPASFSGFTPQDDQQLLDSVARQRPQLRDTYASNLKEVNAYITDAEQNLRQHPNDDQARLHLMDAYDQKAMVYDLAESSVR